MAWSAPMTAVANSAFTAAQFNQFVRDNFNECPTAKATVASEFFVSSGANSIEARRPAGVIVTTEETTTSTSWGDLATVGPTVADLTHGTRMFILLGCTMSNNTAQQVSRMSFEVTGAGSRSPDEGRSLSVGSEGAASPANVAVGHGLPLFIGDLTPGVSTVEAKYRVSGGTGNFVNRRIQVLPW